MLTDLTAEELAQIAAMEADDARQRRADDEQRRHAALLETGLESGNRDAPRKRGRDAVADEETVVSIPAASAYDGDASRGASRRFKMVAANALPQKTIDALNAKRCAASTQARAPPILRCVPTDVWLALLRFVDTHSIRMLAATCASMAVVARKALAERLASHPEMDAEVHLLPEQHRAYRLAVYARKSIFLTGEAGSGKSVTFRAIAAGLRARQRSPGNPPIPKDLPPGERAKYEALRVVICAPTGTAAEVCGGRTLASVFGTFPDELVSVADYRMRLGSGDVDAMCDMDVLMIDEVSMISEQSFAILDRLLRLTRRSKDPFGGVQLVVCGDFAQLPPVSRDRSPTALSRRCFTSPLWRCMFGDPYDIYEERMLMLPTSVRQKDDERELRAVLGELRMFSATQRVSALLRKRSFAELRARGAPELAEPSIVIAATNRTVAAINEQQMRALIDVQKVENHTYRMWYNREANGRDQDAPGPLRLAVGARVSLMRNALPFRLTNGSTGRVVRFARLNDPAVYGPASRVTDLESTPLGTVVVLASAPIEIDTETKRVTSRESASFDTLTFPVVEFDAQPGRLYLITYWGTPISIPQREEREHGSLTRYHVPLRIAYAETIHRVQGGTKHCVVRLDLEACFQAEQLYVAVSRVCAERQLVIVKEPNYKKLFTDTPKPVDTLRFLEALQLRLELIRLRKAKELEEIHALNERAERRAAAAKRHAAKRHCD